MKRFLFTVWNSIRRDSLASAGSLTILLILVMALLAPTIATHDPNEMNYRSEGSALWIGDAEDITLEEAIVPQTLRSVAWDGSSWIAVGENGTLLARFENEWERVDVGVEETLRGVSIASGLGVAVGDRGSVIHLTAGEWISEQIDSAGTLNGASVNAAGGMLAVGDQGQVFASGAAVDPEAVVDLEELDEPPQQAWQAIEDAAVSMNLYGVSLADDGFGVIVGARGALFHWESGELVDGGADGFRDLNSVSVYDRENALAVGDRGTVLRWDGESWSEMTAAVSRNLRSVTMTAPDRAIAVGTHGDIMILEGEQWTRVRSGYDRHFRGSAGAGENSFVVVGTDPYINALSPPSSDHLFGTTHNGRDIFSQVVYGSRTALLVGFIAAVMVTVIGTNVGLVSGYFKGRTDSVLMRIVDIMYALPLEPFAMVLVLLWRPGIGIIILAVGLLTWRTTARLIRSQVLSLSGRPFVKAARVAGSGHMRILYVHIAPNVLPLAFLQLAVAMAFAITAEATLSFLGLGPPRLYSWGTILHQARLSGAWRVAWWWVIPPGVLIMVTVVAVFFISRALEVIANPRLSRS